MRHKELFAFHIHFIFICIQKFDRPILVQCFHTFIQRIRRQQIVMIGESNKISGCDLQRFVRIFRDLKLFSRIYDTDPRIFVSKFIQNALDRRIFSAPIGKTQLPILIRLRLHGLYKLPQIILRRLVKRHDDRNLWRILKMYFTLCLQHFCCRRIPPDPCFIIDRILNRDLLNTTFHRFLKSKLLIVCSRLSVIFIEKFGTFFQWRIHKRDRKIRLFRRRFQMHDHFLRSIPLIHRLKSNDLIRTVFRI